MDAPPASTSTSTSTRTPTNMDSLPPELIGLILRWIVAKCRWNKNALLPLRRVCKAFDAALRPYILKTVQLEFSRFRRDGPRLDMRCLERWGGLVEAFYLDLMVIRDGEEIHRLNEVFRSVIPNVPEMAPVLASLQKYCMDESTFDESDYKSLVESVVERTPNLKRLKVNLPFQVVGHLSMTATLLLASTFWCLARRPEEHHALDILVLDHVTDTTINSICNNHMDLKNAIAAFASLKHLVMSIKRQEPSPIRQAHFTNHLWFLLRKASELESMCLIGWNVKRDIKSRLHQQSMSFMDWSMRSLPYVSVERGGVELTRLRCLELKRVDVYPHALVELITECAGTLKELYLIEVYMKLQGQLDRQNTSLWIGHPGVEKSEECCWVAETLRASDALKLDVLRVTCLGYDHMRAEMNLPSYDFDFIDPSGEDRDFDERFVAAVLGLDDRTHSDATGLDPVAVASAVSTPQPQTADSPAPEPQSPPSSPPSAKSAPRLRRLDYDADKYQRETNNPTSRWKRCIDGTFINHNEQALKELQNIITVADRGMTIISGEISRARQLRVDEATGELVDPPPPETGTE